MSDVGNEVKQILSNKLSDQTVQAQSYGRRRKDDSQWFIASCIALLILSVLTMGGVVLYKKLNVYNNQTADSNNIQGEKSLTIQDLRTGLKPVLDSYDGRISALEKRVDTISHRQWLLSIAHNENAALTEAVTGRVAPELKDKHIFIDSEWRLNKIPEFVRLSDEDKRNLMEK